MGPKQSFFVCCANNIVLKWKKGIWPLLWEIVLSSIHKHAPFSSNFIKLFKKRKQPTYRILDMFKNPKTTSPHGLCPKSEAPSAISVLYQRWTKPTWNVVSVVQKLNSEDPHSLPCLLKPLKTFRMGVFSQPLQCNPVEKKVPYFLKYSEYKNPWGNARSCTSCPTKVQLWSACFAAAALSPSQTLKLGSAWHCHVPNTNKQTSTGEILQIARTCKKRVFLRSWGKWISQGGASSSTWVSLMSSSGGKVSQWRRPDWWDEHLPQKNRTKIGLTESTCQPKMEKDKNKIFKKKKHQLSNDFKCLGLRHAAVAHSPFSLDLFAF